MIDHQNSVITRLRDLRARATSGPWFSSSASKGYPIKNGEPIPMDAKNNAFIIAAVNATPALLDVAEAAANLNESFVTKGVVNRDLTEQLNEALKALEKVIL